MGVLCACPYACSTHRGQKRASDLLELELHIVVVCAVVGHQEPNTGPLQEQQMFLTAETSCQSLSLVLLKEESATPGEKKAEYPLAFVNFLL